MVQAEGGLLVRKKAHLNSTCRRWASGQDKSLPAWYKPRAGLRLHSFHFDVDGEELGLSWENNFHVCMEFSGDLVFPVVLFVIQFSSVFPDYLLILIFHSYFPVVICDLTKLQQ